GTDDQLGLRGDYSTQIVFAAGTMTGVETITLLSKAELLSPPAGPEYRYNLKLDDANLAAGERMTIQGNKLGATETVIFDGSAETDG
ncbi:hypothetical protein OSK00_26340, partial [Escherichia coli]|nr:hypothetical protein [Escherichia coli]